MKEQTTKILLENPENLDVFGYDSYYDSIQAKRKELVEQKKEKVFYLNSFKSLTQQLKKIFHFFFVRKKFIHFS
jgi:hypothetical protein